MHDEDMGSPAEREVQIDDAVMGLLLGHLGPWSVIEVEREIGDRVATQDSLGRLIRGGLAHRLDGGFVFASRAARLSHEVGL
jgi:hypothetical protein